MKNTSFDKNDSDSVFLSFIAKEFRQRGTTLRKILSTKVEVRELISNEVLGGSRLHLSDQKALLNSVDEITSTTLGTRSVLKFSQGWSAKGVMLLEKDGENYFDHLSLQLLTLTDIRNKQLSVAESFHTNSPTWIIEEILDGPQPGTIPFDYKFYMFQSNIGIILQIDRNTNPPKIALFNKNFQPLTEDQDYLVTSPLLQQGAPILPRSAVALSRWAIELSRMTDSPFVSVDLYDAKDGPAFGEFTFSPGAIVMRSLTLSRTLIDELDSLFELAECEIAGTPKFETETFSSILRSAANEEVIDFPLIDLSLYERFAHYLCNNGAKGGHRLSEAQEKLELVSPGAHRINRYLVQAHRATASWQERRLKFAPHILAEAVDAVLIGERKLEDVAVGIGLPTRRLQKLVEQKLKTPHVLETVHHSNT